MAQMIMRFHSRVSGLVCCISLIGCTSIPQIDLEDGAAEVQIVVDRSDLPVHCKELGRVSASDGVVGEGREAHVGREDRAVMKLKNRVIQIKGNTLLLVSSRDTTESDYPLPEVAFDCPECRGSVIWKTGVVFDCVKD